MSAFCNLCSKDPDTGELLCVRLVKWVERCPNFSDGYKWDSERETRREMRMTNGRKSENTQLLR